MELRWLGAAHLQGRSERCTSSSNIHRLALGCQDVLAAGLLLYLRHGSAQVLELLAGLVSQGSHLYLNGSDKN